MKVAVGLKVPATPIVPPLTNVMLLAPCAPLVVRLLKLNAPMVAAPVPLKSTVLPVVTYPPVPKVAVALKVPATPMVPPFTSVTLLAPVRAPLSVRLL